MVRSVKPSPSLHCFHSTLHRSNSARNLSTEKSDGSLSPKKPANWSVFLYFYPIKEVKLSCQIGGEPVRHRLSWRCFHLTFNRRNSDGDRQINQVDTPLSRIQPADWSAFSIFSNRIEVPIDLILYRSNSARNLSTSKSNGPPAATQPAGRSTFLLVVSNHIEAKLPRQIEC